MTNSQQKIQDNPNIVTISYSDLLSGRELHAEIGAAFSPEGLGLILVKDCPEFSAKRTAVLHAIRKFALLPDQVKEAYTVPEASYSIGWSHGKEKMKNGVPDVAKGSYYARPLNRDVLTEDAELKKKFPEVYCDNVWPRDELPELEHTFADITRIQVQVGLEICRAFDSYLHQLTGGQHQLGRFYDMIASSISYLGRMLHYFPMEPEANTTLDGLCGWHLDHGCITCVLSPLYLDLQGNPQPKPADCGLHVKMPANGSIFKIDIPEDCLGIQLGETFQVLSGGHLRATPHCVRSCRDPNISREQLALFVACDPSQNMDTPGYSLPFNDVVDNVFLPEGVPLLRDRLQEATTYQDFSVNTFKAYLK